MSHGRSERACGSSERRDGNTNKKGGNDNTKKQEQKRESERKQNFFDVCRHETLYAEHGSHARADEGEADGGVREETKGVKDKSKSTS